MSKDTLRSFLSDRMKMLFEEKLVNNYITPLFWLHGESREVILGIIEQMHSVGVSGFILESRPFADFLEASWWETIGFILEEAEKRNLKVFVFDDIKFPSGFAAGRIGSSHPEYLKLYLKEKHFDLSGPLTEASFRLSPWLEPGDQLVRVLIVKMSKDGSSFDAADAEDVTACVSKEGVLYRDVPIGRHRIFLFIRTRHGGEEHTRDYLNPLNRNAVKAYIDEVYETHYLHFGEYFGKTFVGFFSDEPRFGSAESYSAALGQLPMVLPYSDELPGALDVAFGGDFSTMLPCLWYDGGTKTAQARSVYMDVVSRLYAENYIGQIGDWCRAHNVKLIGHLVEDNGAHTRLGYGSGHFFRAIGGQDWSGVDVVLHQIMPGFTSGKYQSSFGLYDADFFYWGLAKLASSAGHLDPQKQGITFCEAFGAYGWQEGLKLMKWLTDHFCVRGINHFVPHAFSAKEFPDTDCPPHFYAHGNNPQWRYFRKWADYANRICHLLSGGVHVAPVAVIYHAEAEWTGGEYDPFEKVAKILMQHQIDCDIVPVDYLSDDKQTSVSAGEMRINNESYQLLVVPFSECLPESFLERLNDFAEQGLGIVFMQELPLRGVINHDCDIIARLQSNPLVSVLQYTTLVEKLFEWNIFDIRVASAECDLQYYHYYRREEDIYFFVNGSTLTTIDTRVMFSQQSRPLGYDPMHNAIYEPAFIQTDNGTSVEICLEAFESTFIIFSPEHNQMPEQLPPPPLKKNMLISLKLETSWRTSIATAKQFPAFSPAPEITGLGNVSTPEGMPFFSGTIRYETEFELHQVSTQDKIFLDLGEVYETAAVSLNGRYAGTCITPPYRVEISGLFHHGVNQLQIDVTNTLDKQLESTIFERSIAREPSGLIGPVQVLAMQSS